MRGRKTGFQSIKVQDSIRMSDRVGGVSVEKIGEEKQRHRL